MASAPVPETPKPVIPDHKLMFVPVEIEAEAHFVCALLNSAVTVFLVKSYAIETQTSTHVLEHVRLPRFNADDKQHARLLELSRQAHTLTAKLAALSQSPLRELAEASKGSAQSVKELRTVEAELDSLAAEVWGISDAELRDIQSSLADLR